MLKGHSSFCSPVRLLMRISDTVSNFAADVNGEKKKQALAPISQGKKAQLDCYPRPGH